MHQQSARRTPSTATFPQPAQVAAIPQAFPEPVRGCARRSLLPSQRRLSGDRRYPATAIEQLAASLVPEVRAA
jgi:hypothetical protein